ncbi:hypothetical protein BX616_000806 [Lobosporangium transversale]|uniref:UBX domain-containing protein n=1 Tax=Lobosporangium transversale TaxID=64571 RepID=A0A1Y2GWH1_9FUNG|nr:hypothetical protein BCR41DRAFT_348687 [Lobosporangium transversale]KAF9917500.1 hypothetical protein BX616_000806 [Lobosporangium transversale]ORZ24895.1 hypothetical protein BCR41DRAFT_348687 [Lobosporangium transversale]|eukprot:XP_021883876.1 hypothetical protein BCR41DRAFT_348687 [Lobosporangium transversale]
MHQMPKTLFSLSLSLCRFPNPFTIQSSTFATHYCHRLTYKNPHLQKDMETLDQLTEEQKNILDDYLAVTGQNDLEIAVLALEQHSWQLETAVQAQFGDTRTPSRPDESLGGLGLDRNAENQTTPPPPPPPLPSQPHHVTAPRSTNSFSRSFLSWFSWPINTIWSVTWSLLAYFYTLFPQTFRQAITGRSSQSGPSRPPQDPASVAARFLREYEENYGTEHPNFYAGGYSAALSKAKNDLKYLVVYLHSDEHDATDAFCRETLANPELLSYLRSNDFLVWGGNVKETEGFQVATTLQTVRYPFIGLIALSQSTTGSSATKMVLIDRIEGPSTAEQIIQRLTQQVARQSAALERLRAERRERELAREIRQQQDDAYEQSLRADREKARQQKEAREAAERQKREEERLEAERLAALERKERHMKYLFENLPEEPAAGEPGCATLSFKLWNGERIIRRFRGTEPVENVYVFIETIEFRENGSKADLQLEAEQHLGYTHEYDFVLISPFPRVKVTDREKLIKDEPALWPSASLVVELKDDEDVDE